MIRGLFAYAGAKTRHLPEYAKSFKDVEFDTFYDLFCGAGTLSYWVYKNRDYFKVKKLVLNEINTKIYELFNELKFNHDKFYGSMVNIEREYLKLDHKVRKEFYYDIRNQVNKNYDPVLFYTCLKLCFNGVYQQNKQGDFTTAFGDGKEKILFDHKTFNEYSEMLQMATLHNTSYEHVDIEQHNTSLIYCDPPYINSNTKYCGEFDQHKFIEYALSLKQSGNKVMIANKQSDTYLNLFDDSWLKVRLKAHYTASRNYTTQHELLIIG